MVNLHPVLLNKWYSVQRVMIYKIIKHSKVFFLKKKKKRLQIKEGEVRSAKPQEWAHARPRLAHVRPSIRLPTVSPPAPR